MEIEAKKYKRKFLDTFSREAGGIDEFKKEKVYFRIDKHHHKKTKSVLFSRGKKTTDFFTEDSKLYITPKEYNLLKQGIPVERAYKKWDSICERVVSRYLVYQSQNKSFLYKIFVNRYKNFTETVSVGSQSYLGRMSMAKLWNASIVGAILLGMISTSFFYKHFGQGASAGNNILVVNENQEPFEEQVLGAETQFPVLEKEEGEYLQKILEDLKGSEKKELEEKINNMVKDYPIEKMVPYIVERDKIVAAFLIAISKKESNWGKNVPVLNGADCYNYWGFRAQRKLMGSGGHTCFNSRKDAVNAVSQRLEFLVDKYKKDTPEKMVTTWKCGSSCENHSDASVQKWIADVEKYFGKLNE